MADKAALEMIGVFLFVATLFVIGAGGFAVPASACAGAAADGNGRTHVARQAVRSPANREGRIFSGPRANHQIILEKSRRLPPSVSLPRCSRPSASS